ncbi:MAG TPA: Spy/CpxP family protein refolding chaperone [Terracidiphilus sp.]|nr:Spy/CpxP family protein refolding chaperone [Terracidiphilus sp.]
MIRKILWTSIGAALIVAGITAAWTQTQQWHAGRGPIWFHHGPMGYIAHELDLSDTQKEQIKSIWEGERPNVAELIHELASEQNEMEALTSQSAPDEGRIQDVGTRQGATLAKLIIEKEKLTGRIYSQVLNPAQRTKADELRRRWSSHLDQVANRIGNATGTK